MDIKDAFEAISKQLTATESEQYRKHRELMESIRKFSELVSAYNDHPAFRLLNESHSLLESQLEGTKAFKESLEKFNEALQPALDNIERINAIMKSSLSPYDPRKTKITQPCRLKKIIIYIVE